MSLFVLNAFYMLPNYPPTVEFRQRNADWDISTKINEWSMNDNYIYTQFWVWVAPL